MKRSPWILSFALLALMLSATSLVSHGCTASQALVVTGESLRVLGDEFVTCAASMDAALDAGRITPAQYRDWAHFGVKFKQTYPLGVQLWEAAHHTEDAALERQAAGVVSTLAVELGAFYSMVRVATEPRDGGP